MAEPPPLAAIRPDVPEDLDFLLNNGSDVLADALANPDVVHALAENDILSKMIDSGNNIIDSDLINNNFFEEVDNIKAELEGGFTGTQHEESWIGSIFGLVYTTIWALAWYPQIYQNYKDKSAIGYCYDLVVYNVYGFILYSVYTITQYTYQRKHGLEEAVDWQDIFFSVHSLVVNLFYMGQSWYYNGRPPFVAIGYFCRVYIFISIMILIAHVVFALFGWISWVSVPGAVDERGIAEDTWSVAECMGIIKAVITVIKYPSQVVFNYDRQSTQGMNVLGFVMDLTGGTAAIAQNLSDSIVFNDFAFMTANLPKVIVAGSSVFWDVFLIIQGYFLYPNREPLPMEQRPSVLKPSNIASKIMIFFAPEQWPQIPEGDELTPSTIKHLNHAFGTEISSHPLWHHDDGPYNREVEMPTLVRFDYDLDDSNMMITPEALRTNKHDLVLQ